MVGPDEVAGLVPGMVTDDIVAAAYEPESGYADPTGTAAGFLAAARALGARLVQGCRVLAVTVDGDRVTGVETERGHFGAPIVVDVAGAWAAELARTVGVEIPVQAWRHDTAYFGLPAGRTTDFPIVIDDINAVYFRPEGRELMLVGLEAGNVVGGSPDRPLAPCAPEHREAMVARVCARVPWMADGHVPHRARRPGRDHARPAGDPRGRRPGRLLPRLRLLRHRASRPRPAVGACVAELILDGRATTVDITAYTHRRFAEGRPLVGEHPYGSLWR